MSEPNTTELRATVERLEEIVARRTIWPLDAEPRCASDQRAVHDALPALLATIKALLEDRERLEHLTDVAGDAAREAELDRCLISRGTLNRLNDAIAAARAKEARP